MPFTIYHKTTGEQISCEDKEQRALMLKNPNFVLTAKEVISSKQQATAKSVAGEEQPEQVKVSSNRRRVRGSTAK